jgi:hypothetical protein
MDPTSNSPDHSSPVPPPAARSFWRSLGGGSLSISLILHGILLAIGVVWVFQIIPAEPDKVVDFMPASGGGGSGASEVKVKQRQEKLAQPNLSRVVAFGSAGLTLPEPEPLTQMASLGGLTTGALSAGKGGPGSGGGKGNGKGLGIGGGLAPGINTGIGTKNPFGMLTADQGALVGNFYDLKQTSNRRPTEMTDDEFRKELKDITKRGFKDAAFRKYYKAPRELFQSKLHIPLMAADGAPAAFECEKEVQPKRWIVVYRGAVQAPQTGKFRFVGACDDALFVRFNNREVFDYGYTLASTGTYVIGKSGDLADSKDKSGLQNKLRKDCPMPFPITYYKYSKLSQTNKNIGGMAVGPEFQVEAGKTYPVEILISEIPGGYFSVSLLIEEIGATYKKDPAGFPILPLFRLDDSVPDPKLKGEAPPFDPKGPIWKYVPGSTKPEI